MNLNDGSCSQKCRLALMSAKRFMPPASYIGLKAMTLLFSLLTWLAPLVLILVWQWSQWQEKHPEVIFSDWLRADPYIVGLLFCLLFLWLIPLGIWMVLVGGSVISAILAARSEQQRREWKQRSNARALAIVFVLIIHLLAGFVPASTPIGEEVWGAPLSEEQENASPWPASEQYIWVLADGAIVVETHLQVPGVLNPMLAPQGVKFVSDVSGAKEDRFQEAASLMDDWTGTNAFSLSPIHGGVVHDYGDVNLLYTHDDIMLDLFGMHPSGEMITVWIPTWGGEIHLLTVIKMGPDPFLGNPGAQSYVDEWLSV